jgi:hypothetical protein
MGYASTIATTYRKSRRLATGDGFHPEDAPCRSAIAQGSKENAVMIQPQIQRTRFEISGAPGLCGQCDFHIYRQAGASGERY